MAFSLVGFGCAYTSSGYAYLGTTCTLRAHVKGTLTYKAGKVKSYIIRS